MARSAQSSTPSSLVEDIGFLASLIMRALGDESVEPQARAVAQYMLLCKSMTRCECATMLGKPGAGRLLAKLLDCESEFMGPTPRAVGIDVVVFTSANKIQESLNVKHYKQGASLPFECTGRVKPKIKNNILYSDSEYIWVRVHCNRRTGDGEEPLRPFTIPETRTFGTMDAADNYYASHSKGVTNWTVRELHHAQQNKRKTVYEAQFANATSVFKVCTDVYEVYVAKTSTQSDSVKIEHLLQRYGYDDGYSLIFCSELKYFKQPLLFISNYLKFNYCYQMNHNIFDPKHYDEIKAVTLYLTQCSLFMSSSNLTTMPTDTHGPLIAYTGERPKVLMSKFTRCQDDGDDENVVVYTNEGTRAMQTTDKCSDLGARSNYVEVVSQIELDPSVLDGIL